MRVVTDTPQVSTGVSGCGTRGQHSLKVPLNSPFNEAAAQIVDPAVRFESSQEYPGRAKGSIWSNAADEVSGLPKTSVKSGIRYITDQAPKGGHR
jgi:hypothetical protein